MQRPHEPGHSAVHDRPRALHGRPYDGARRHQASLVDRLGPRGRRPDPRRRRPAPQACSRREGQHRPAPDCASCALFPSLTSTKLTLLFFRAQVVLVTNLFKLVRTPDLAAAHCDAVLPGIERIIESAAFPEIRAFAETAKKAVDKSIVGASIPAIDHLSEALGDERTAYSQLVEAVEAKSGAMSDAFVEASIKTAAYAVSQLVRKRALGEKEWKDQYVGPYIAHFVGKDAADEISLDLLKKWVAVDKERNRVEGADDDDDEEGEILIDLPFSLAYGGLLLLNHTALKLRKGHRYGICGANGCGKSTLLKAINRKQIDGFPDDIKAAYVEHDIEGDESGITVCQLMLDEPRINATEKEVRDMLEEMGFSPERQDVSIISLSGGWKMRCVPLSLSHTLSDRVEDPH